MMQFKIEDSTPTLYEPGQLTAHDFIYDGKTSVNGHPLKDYMKSKPELILIPFSDFMERVKKIEDETILGDWVEVDRARFWEMLEVLPPEKWWQCGEGQEAFRMVEYYIGIITTHFVRIGKRYFEANRRISQDYKEMIEEIKKQFEL